MESERLSMFKPTFFSSGSFFSVHVSDDEESLGLLVENQLKTVFRRESVKLLNLKSKIKIKIDAVGRVTGGMRS